VKRRHSLYVVAVSIALLAAAGVPVAAQSSSPSAPSMARFVSAAFARPFEYSIPDAMTPGPRYEDQDVLALAEGPSFPFGWAQDEAGESGARGVIVVEATDVVTHPCHMPSADSRVDIADGPAAFLDDMHAIAGLNLEDEVATTFDGRPAVSAISLGSDCGTADIHLAHSSMAWVRLDIPSRLIVTEVAGSTVLVQAWAGTPEGLESWLPIAQEFIDSIHFVDPVAGQA
jgi:hypothetical protein